MQPLDVCTPVHFLDSVLHLNDPYSWNACYVDELIIDYQLVLSGGSSVYEHYPKCVTITDMRSYKDITEHKSCILFSQFHTYMC